MKTIRNPRELAVRCLIEVDNQGLLISDAMARFPTDMSPEDLNLAHKITYDSFRYLPGLTGVLSKLCKHGKLPDKIAWLLLSSLCQIRYTRAPDYAVVDEANKLAVRMGFRGLKPLVNGVLRSALRADEELWEEESDAAWLLPDWLELLLSSQYEAQQVTTWFETWREKGQVSYWSSDDKGLDGDAASPVLPHAFRPETPPAAQLLERKRLYLQNETSQAIAELACRLKPQSVLDLCAAPGGKSAYIGAFGGVTRQVAVDPSPERVARMLENFQRLGLDIEVQTTSAQAFESDDLFDLVLVDAPCSGLGIIGRHPEIKHLRKAPAGDEQLQLQIDILNHAWAYVRPGGRLLYTVCSLDQQERPEPPKDAVLDAQSLDLWPDDLPVKLDQGRFAFEPTSAFDGFLGMLLQKPR